MSRSPYFPFYPSDFMNGVRGLTAQEVGVYIMILCRIYEESRPVEYHVRRLSTYCGMRESTFKTVVEKLLDLDKFQLVEGALFNRRAEIEIQKRSDGLKFASSAGKVSAQKRQQNQRKVSTPVDGPFNHTDTDTDTDIDKKKDTYVSSRGSFEIQDAVEAYNSAASQAGWPTVQKVTDQRKAQLRGRLSDVGGIDGWRAAMARASGSDFLCGRVNSRDGPFIASFDWITKPANFTKIMEGNYDNRSRNQSPENSTLRAIINAANAFEAPSLDWGAGGGSA